MQEVENIMEYSFTLDETISDKEIEYVGVFPKGHVSIVAGEPAVGKTWFMLSVAKAIADGAVGLGSGLEGKPYRKGRVLIFAGETGVKLLADRLKLLGGCLHIEDIRVLSSQALLNVDIDVMINTAIGRKNIGHAIASFRPDIVFFDTVISFMSAGKDESSQVDMADPIRGLSGLANKYETAIVLLHHFRKRAKAEGNSQQRDINEVIGSSAFIRLASLVVGIERRGEARMIRCLKSWWREFLPFSFILRNGKNNGVEIDASYEYDSTGTKSAVPAMRRARDFILQKYKNGEEFTLANVMTLSGIGRNSVSDAINALFSERRLIEVVSKKNKMRVYRLVEDNEGEPTLFDGIDEE